MSCPLGVAARMQALHKLPLQFNTLDFIAVCPNSGGTEAGKGCPAVGSGGRGVCGKGLAEYAKYHFDLQKLDGAASPARWRRAAGGAVAGAPAGSAVGAEVPTARGAEWVDAEQRRQVAWKEDECGVVAQGSLAGRSVDYLFPADDWALNLLDEHRGEVIAHIEAAGIELHTFAHHVRSSRIFALNLAAPFFARPELLAGILSELLPDGPSVASVERVEAEGL
jgi:hypothetical protein